jgi:hypothetical protein
MYNVGRFISGIVLNPMEYLEDEQGNIMVFKNIEEVEELFGYSKEALEEQGVYVVEAKNDLQDT